GIFGTAHHDHLELRRDNVEPFRDVLADPVLEAAAARAGLVGYVDDDLFAWEVDRQRTAIDVSPARRGLLLSGGAVLRRGVCRRERLLHRLQRPRRRPLGASVPRPPAPVPAARDRAFRRGARSGAAAAP